MVAAELGPSNKICGMKENNIISFEDFIWAHLQHFQSSLWTQIDS